MSGSASSGASSAAAPRRLRLPVPTTILTGALASGKTTAIAGLLRAKPPGEVWAVLVNEFGAAGLDAALLEGGAAGPPAGQAGCSQQQGEQQAAGAAAAAPAARSAALASPSGGGTSSGGAGVAAMDGVHVRQLAGGCLCCALSSMAPLAIAQLVRNVKPDRLLVEPSGLAHPAALLDMLQGAHLGGSLALQPVVCLVDATQFAGGAASPVACEASQLLMDQISIADVLVGSKADLCDPATLAAFDKWASQLFPPKALVTTAAGGQLKDSSAAAELLSWPAAAAGSDASSSSSSGKREGTGRGGGPAPPGMAGHKEQPAAASQQQLQQLPVQRVRRASVSTPWLSSSEPVKAAAEATAADAATSRLEPLRKQVQDGSGAYAACGWILHRDCVFNLDRLHALLQQLVPRTLRVKGVFRVSPNRWVAVSAAPAGPRVVPAALEVAEASAASCAATGSSSSGSSGMQEHGATAVAAPVELREIAYRRDSRVEVILDTAAAAAAAAAGAGEAAGEERAAAEAGTAEGPRSPTAGGGGGGSSRLEAQAAGLSLTEDPISSGIGGGGSNDSSGVSLQRRVVAALRSAAAGDWDGLEALVLGTLAGE